MKAAAPLTLIVAVFAVSLAQASEGVCRAQSPVTPPTIVELYTSEGCSSCPPADRWLSTLKGRPDVLALAFHVNYWDRLGWADRFARAEATARQYEWARLLGSAQVYTPQVLVNGRDWRSWPRLPERSADTQAPSISLQRDGDSVNVQVAPTASGRQLAGYWAVLEDQHESRVRAGENAGETLRHDHVVRLVQTLPMWTGSAGRSDSLNVVRGIASNPRRVVFVVTDPATGRPLQAATLAC